MKEGRRPMTLKRLFMLNGAIAAGVRVRMVPAHPAQDRVDQRDLSRRPARRWAGSPRPRPTWARRSVTGPAAAAESGPEAPRRKATRRSTASREASCQRLRRRRGRRPAGAPTRRLDHAAPPPIRQDSLTPPGLLVEGSWPTTAGSWSGAPGCMWRRGRSNGSVTSRPPQGVTGAVG